MNNGLQTLENGAVVMVDNKINTSISVDKDLWKEFSILVLQKEGNRKLSDVIEILIRQYIKKNTGGNKEK